MTYLNESSYIITDSTVTIYHNDSFVTVDDTYVNWDKIVEAVRCTDFDTALMLSDSVKDIEVFGDGMIEVTDGVIYYMGKAIHNALTSRILSMIEQDFDVQPLVNFLHNLMDNPSGRAVQELYRFLECNRLPITPDGYFLAYKNVGHDYMDRHSGTFDNSVGSVCSMPRNEVMDDPNQTCSAGLHFCSIEYLNGTWGHGGHTMVVKVNPADVVSIPVDYNNSKGRTCAYEVIAEHFDEQVDTLSEHVVWQEPENDSFFDYEEDVSYHNKRDSMGRFTA